MRKQNPSGLKLMEYQKMDEVIITAPKPPNQTTNVEKLRASWYLMSLTSSDPNLSMMQPSNPEI